MPKPTKGNALLQYVHKDRSETIAASCILYVGAGEQVAFDLSSGGHWYGHGFSHVQLYPLETGEVVNDCFAVNNIQSPIWMASAGYAIFAETTAPLDVRINERGDGQLRIRCDAQPLTVRVFLDETLPDAHRQLMRHLGWPNRPPTEFGDVLFCTWTQFPRCITQVRVLEMARQIRSRGYACSTLIIDDRWESQFGELTFSADFPDPRAMVDELHAMGFAVWLWTTPFVNREAATFENLSRSGVLVSHRNGAGAAILKWWGGEAGLIDVTNPDGRAWFRERLLHLKNDLGVDGFKIDGGDFKYQPPPETAAFADPSGASGYSDALLAVYEELVPHQCETRTAWLSQSRRILWRQGGKDSHWGRDNGLKAMISLGLHLALMGYDIQIPDMVPGRVQTMDPTDSLPTDELMVRWTEASIFFPLVQFSYLPWNYAESTAAIIAAYARLHKALGLYIADQAVGRRGPLLRPIWYDAPEVESLYAVFDEFMLGGDLLVAPVLDQGVSARDVLLPPGRWLDAWTGDEYDHGLIESHPSPCPGVPIFVRAGNGYLVATVSKALAGIHRGVIPPHITTATWSAGLSRDLNVSG